jgi:hypothetical protein
MFLDAAKVPEIQRLLATDRPDTAAKLRGAEVSLTVALFLALAHRVFAQSGNRKMAGGIEQLNLAGVARAIKCLEHTGPQLSSDPFSAPLFDLYPGLIHPTAKVSR